MLMPNPCSGDFKVVVKSKLLAKYIMLCLKYIKTSRFVSIKDKSERFETGNCFISLCLRHKWDLPVICCIVTCQSLIVCSLNV